MLFISCHDSCTETLDDPVNELQFNLDTRKVKNESNFSLR